jgi:hypothetical protein
MKNIFSFLSYHNAVPAVLIVLALGAGSAFAATATGILPLPVLATPAPSADILAPEGVDASALLSANLDAFDFHPTVTGVVETDTLYTVSYSVETLAPEGSEWAAVSKSGEFSVAKDSLGDGGLNTYVVQKLGDIENQGRTYLFRAQAAERKLAGEHAARPSSAFAALIGLVLDQIPVPVVRKPIPVASEPQASPVQDVVQEWALQTKTADSGSVDASMADASVVSSATSTDTADQAASSTPPVASPATSETATSTPSITPAN